MTLSQASVVQRVRVYLGDYPWETTGSAASASSTVEVDDNTDWAQGDLGEFVEDGDSFRVNDIDGGWDGNVIRSFAGSTGAAHTAGARIYKNPKYRYLEITNAISTVIQGFLPWPRVYKVTADTITPSTSSAWFDLAADALDLVSVYQLSDGAPVQRHSYGDFHQWGKVLFDRKLPTGLVTSGVGVSFPDGFWDNDNTVYINYAAKITDTVSTGAYADFSDGEAVTEAIILGAVQVLQRALELRKNRSSQTEPDYIRSGRDFNSLFQSALNSAEKELRLKSPLMRASAR